MAEMFDGVTGAYDRLNRLMTLGQDAAWRRAMWAGVPEEARVVVDLCTGNGVSLPGLRRPGRLVIGVDVSFGMLEVARDEHGGPGWAPRVLCADGFRLPLRDASVDAVTVAFGIRNLRPRGEALAEIARVLCPGGALSVLEATAPRPGPLAPFHRLHLRHVVPLLGRLSPDPAAYRYLAESILEFGDGREFEAALDEAGFRVERRRRYLLGAAALWVARRGPARGEIPSAPSAALRSARNDGGERGRITQTRAPGETEWRVWTAGQLVVSAALTVALVYGLAEFAKLQSSKPLEDWQRQGGWALLGGGMIAFAVRTAVLWMRLFGPPRGR